MKTDDSENKKIAKLDFDISKASSQLEKLNLQLKTASEEAIKYAKTIGTSINSALGSTANGQGVGLNIKADSVKTDIDKISNSVVNLKNKTNGVIKGVDFSKMVNVEKVSAQLAKVESLTEKDAQKMVAQVMKQESRLAANKKKNADNQLALQEKTTTKLYQKEVEKNNKIELDSVHTANRLKTIEAQRVANVEKYNAKAESSFKTLGNTIQRYAETWVIYQGFNQLKNAIIETTREMVEVEYKMMSIDRVLNDSSINIDKYRDSLIQLAFDYGNAFNDVADITERLVKAGFDANEALSLTENTLLALNTADLNAEQATEDIIAVMAQWGQMDGDLESKTKWYSDLIDKVNKVGDNYATTSEDILEALKKTSSAFNIAGASIDETIAIITAAEIASQRGGKTIGTALSNIAQQLKETGRLTTAENLGLNFYTDTTKSEFKGIIEIFQEMSDKMQELKNAGKENSTEMQELLTIFTVFRRNIGSSLLGEMSGEDNTYLDILNTSLGSVGYSLQENSKHMQTTLALQNQFNATLLQLKTSVWDNGVEDVYRSILFLGMDFIKQLGTITDALGVIPTAVGAITLALTLLSKNMRVAKFDMETGMVSAKGFVGVMIDLPNVMKQVNALQHSLRGGLTSTNIGLKESIQNLSAYTLKLGAAAAKTLALKTATLALNVATSVAMSAAMTLVTSIIQEIITKEGKAIEMHEKSIKASQEKVESLQNESDAIVEAISKYEEFSSSLDKSPDSVTEITELQQKINSLLDDQADKVDLINGNYDEQKAKLQELNNQTVDRLLNEAKIYKMQKENQGVKFEYPSWVEQTFGDKDYEKVLKKEVGFNAKKESSKLGASTFADVSNSNNPLFAYLENIDQDEALELLNQWEEKLRDIQDESLEIQQTYDWITENIRNINDLEKERNEATEDYYDILADKKADEWFGKDKIKNVEDYSIALKAIDKMDFEGMDEIKEKLKEAIALDYPEYASDVANETKNSAVEMDALNKSLSDSMAGLVGLQNNYGILTSAVQEYNETGRMSVATLQALVDNDLLQYFDVLGSKLGVNEAAFANAASAAKADAISNLQAKTAAEIAAIAFNANSTAVTGAGNAASGASSNVDKVRVALQNINPQIITTTGLWAGLKATMGDTAGDLSADQTAQIDKVLANYKNVVGQINNIKLEPVSYKKASSGGGGSGAANAAKRAAEEAAEAAKKAEEDAYKERLDSFENYLKDRDKLESDWVSDLEDLDVLSSSDLMYIARERVYATQRYLDEIRKITWMNAEDKLSIEKEYSRQVKEYQVDYFEYLGDKLDDEINALEEANKKKIDLIEEEADAKIEALKKVEAETDRIRDKEDYESERQEILDEISYWNQRTGREAIEALADAKKNLADLDEDWKETLEDWSIEDQITKIENQRDAQIEAIEKSEEAEIASLQRIYDEKVRLFVETGNVIYESSVIQSQALYNAYKANFIDPLMQDLNRVGSSLNVPVAPATTSSTDTYTIKKGDTLSKIAKQFGTTVAKIMEANPYIKNKNKIYTGNKLQIPKFHEGGIVGGVKEGYALLKPNEVILKPSWAGSLDRMMKYFDNVTTNNITTNNSVPTIEVNGNLINIDAEVRNNGDIDEIGKRVEKILKSKFNINR